MKIIETINWYKKAQEIVTDPHQQDCGYMGIGHEGCYYDNKTGKIKYREYELPNIIWTFINGELKMEEATGSIQLHRDAFPDVEIWSFYGRYEQDSGKLSIVIPPNNKIAKARKEIPNVVMKRLLSAFPKAKQVFIF